VVTEGRFFKETYDTLLTLNSRDQRGRTARPESHSICSTTYRLPAVYRSRCATPSKTNQCESTERITPFRNRCDDEQLLNERATDAVAAAAAAAVVA